MRSGVGVNNPPIFLYLMGILTYFTNNPLYLTAFFTVLNLLALIITMRYFYLTLPRMYAFLASVLLAFSPAFTTYTSIIWAQCVLPFLMILFNISLYKFILKEKTIYLFFMTMLVVMASQFHLSGFFIFPAVLSLIILYRKKIDKKILVLTMLSVLFTFLPYLYHLFYEKELSRFISYGVSIQRDFPWKVFREHFRMSSFDFYRYYFRDDFNAVLNKSVGIFSYILYPLSALLMVFFFVGFFSYIKWLIKEHRLFDVSTGEPQKYPLPFQISGFLITTVTIGYLVFRVRTPMHYLIILFPAYSVITGFALYKTWKYLWGRIIICSTIFSTIILLVCVFLFIDRAGGHPREYGPHYRTLLNWKREISSVVPKGYCADLSINFIGKGKFDEETAMSILKNADKCDSNKVITLIINISWNEKLMRYEHSIIKKQDKES
jgi:hypothetical protein